MYQNIEIIGRLGRKPEMRYLPAGTAITSFSVATDNQYTSASGEKVKETTWFRVQVLGKMGEACNQYLDKGSLVFVSGRMVSDKATGGPKIWKKQDGEAAASFEINASAVKFLSTHTATAEAEQSGGVSQSDDSEIPF